MHAVLRAVIASCIDVYSLCVAWKAASYLQARYLISSCLIIWRRLFDIHVNAVHADW